MNKAGVVFIISGAFVYFLASQTQVGWVYLFDALIWSLVILALLIPRASLKSLKVERQVLLTWLAETELNGPTEDEKIEVRLTVTNHGRFARHFIKIIEDCPFAPPDKRQQTFFIPRLEPRATVAFNYEVEGYKRGHYPSATITLHASDPLGLMMKKKSIEFPLNLTVYPRYYSIEATPAADATWAEWGLSVRSNAAEELYGSREYRYGDPLKHIHWRNTARLGQFMLKEFEQSRQGEITVVFDTRHDFGSGRDTTLEYSIKIAASLAKLCADLGRSINIIAGERPLYYAGWLGAMDFLSRLEDGTESKLEPVPEPGQVIVAIASARDTDLIPVIQKWVGWGRLSLVLLEGFAPKEKPDEFLSQLRGDGVDLIRCTPGNLETATKNLASSRSFDGRLTVV